MRENKHSKKLAFAVLAATAAVGVSAVAPVSAASINTADGLIVTSDTPVSSNVAVPTTVVTGSGNIAVGQQNEVRSTSGSTSAFGNQNYVNGQDANAFGDGNAAFGHYAQVFGDTNEANGNQTVAYGYNNIVGEFQAASSQQIPIVWIQLLQQIVLLLLVYKIKSLVVQKMQQLLV